MRVFVRRYGAHPLHLLVLIASFALAGYAADRLLAFRWLAVAIWFAGAAVGHDLLLLPLYGIADAGLVLAWRRRGTDLPTAPWINYIRVPTMMSGMLLLIYFPSIFRLSGSYTLSTGLTTAHYLGDWLLVTGIVYLASATVFAIRLRYLSSRRGRSEPAA